MERESKVKIEIDIPTEIIVWQHPDAVKAACPPTGRLPVLLATGKAVSTGVYMSYHDEFWCGKNGQKKVKPQKVDWCAKLPVPPGQPEAEAV